MAAARAPHEPNIIAIADGVYAQVVEPVSPLPPRLDALLAGLTVVRRFPVRLLGTRRACTDAEHSFSSWMWGVYAGRELRLARCPFCGVVEVRDVSLDILPGAPMGKGGPRRRDAVLGWYAGSRPLGRNYL